MIFRYFKRYMCGRRSVLFRWKSLRMPKNLIFMKRCEITIKFHESSLNKLFLMISLIFNFLLWIRFERLKHNKFFDILRSISFSIEFSHELPVKYVELRQSRQGSDNHLMSDKTVTFCERKAERKNGKMNQDLDCFHSL